MRKTVPNNGNGTLAGVLLLPWILLACFVSIHFAITGGHVLTALIIMLVPLVLLVGRNPATRIAVLAAAGCLILLAARYSADNGLSVLYAPPILVNAGLALLFGHSLLRGNTPLVTRYSILLRGKLEPDVVSYTRNVTRLWTLFFSAMTLETLLLALFAPLEVWSLFANILNYVFTALLFAAEYLFRIRHLSHLEHPGFIRFVTSIFRLSFDDSALKR